MELSSLLQLALLCFYDLGSSSGSSVVIEAVLERLENSLMFGKSCCMLIWLPPQQARGSLGACRARSDCRTPIRSSSSRACSARRRHARTTCSGCGGRMGSPARRSVKAGSTFDATSVRRASNHEQTRRRGGNQISMSCCCYKARAAAVRARRKTWLGSGAPPGLPGSARGGCPGISGAAPNHNASERRLLRSEIPWASHTLSASGRQNPCGKPGKH